MNVNRHCSCMCLPHYHSDKVSCFPLLYNWYHVNLDRHSRLFTTHALYNLFMPLMLHQKFTFFYHVEYIISGKTDHHHLINM